MTEEKEQMLRGQHGVGVQHSLGVQDPGTEPGTRRGKEYNKAKAM